MDRRQFGDAYRTNDVTGSNFQVPISQPGAENVHFYDGLVPGLENLQPMSTANSGQSWGVGGQELGLGAFQHGFGGWTSYPTDDDVSYSSDGMSNIGASTGFMTNEDYFTSLSQPESVCSGSESNFYATRSRSHSEHYDVHGGMAGYDFTRLADTGREAYSEAMGQWAASAPPGEPRAYDLFGTTPLLQQSRSTGPEMDMASPPPAPPQLSKPQSRSNTPETIEPAAKNRPSYSEVARHYPPAGSRSKSLSKEPKSESRSPPARTDGFPDYTGFRLPATRNVHRNRSRPGKVHRPRRRHDVEPTTIKPDSRYGLDTFEQPVNSAKLGAGDHMSVSSGSGPHSRKGSVSSGTGSFCGVDDLDPVSPIEHTKRMEDSDPANLYNNCDSKTWSADGVYGACPQSPAADLERDNSGQAAVGIENISDTPDSGKTEECKRKTDRESDPNGGTETKRSRSSSTPESQEKTNKPKEHVFFDPKRIFAPRPTKPPGKKTMADSTSSSKNFSIPNNQQPQTSASTKIQDSDNILNNDKPKTRPSSNINRSCYINNNLREPATAASTKKQTNAEAQRDAGNHTGHSPSNPQSSSSAGHSHRNPESSSGAGHSHSNPQSSSGAGHSRSNPQPSSQGHSHTIRPPGHARSRAGPGTRKSDAPCRNEHHPRRRPEPVSKTEGNTRHRSDNQAKEEPLGRRKRTADRKTQAEWTQQHALGEMMTQIWHWVLWAVQELSQVLWNITKLVLSLGIALLFPTHFKKRKNFIWLLMLGQHSLSTIKDMWIVITAKFYRRPDTDGTDGATKKTRSQCGLKENIVLPSTGEEAMKRLLAGRGQDPYSILGVVPDASDEVIKKYYRRQAVLVHPDKNQMPGAEESFKILGHAFDLIGEPDKRRLYDTQRLEAQEEEEALHQFADLLTKLHDKVQEATNLMRCENCGGKHRRVPTERPMYAARYCQRCDYSHPVREGDVWAESHMLGFLWNYFACMENRVYDITEWASCQSDRFKHIQANAHNIVYRIATNTNTGGRHRQPAPRSNEADLEDFLSHLFHQSNGTGVPSDRDTAGDPASQYGNFAGETRSGKPSWGQASSAGGSNKKGRRRKKKH